MVRRTMRNLDHYWGLVLCFVVAVAAFAALAVTGNGTQGTLLRAVILTLGGAVAGGYMTRKPPT